MITVVPTPFGVTNVPLTEATLGTEEVNCHGPGEVEVGAFKLNVPTLSRETIISEKAPTAGLMAVIWRVLVVLADKNVLILC